MRKTVSTRDLEEAGWFVIRNLIHVTHVSDMDSDVKKAIKRNLEILDWLIQSELNNRCNKKTLTDTRKHDIILTKEVRK